jgi:hypothetical protein
MNTYSLFSAFTSRSTYFPASNRDSTFSLFIPPTQLVLYDLILHYFSDMLRGNVSDYFTYNSANNDITEIMHYDVLVTSMDPLTVPHVEIIKLS